jgi:Ca-activated chloride channel family protein
MLKKSLAILIFLSAASSARAQSDDSGDGAAATKAISPYFYVAGGDPDTDRLPLKSLSADLRITGAIAAVKVNQVFENHASKPIEAVYVFPASTRAAVHGMRMRIGNRVIEARIDRKKKAREDYEVAKKEGKRASLLEQHRPNVFSMSVANVMPGDRIAVELDYSELLVPESSVYELVFPAVVGPRYTGGADAKKDGWMATPYLKEGSPETYAYSVTAHLRTGVPLQEVSSPSHEIVVTKSGASDADVRLKNPGGGNKDFILHYKLAGGEVQTGLLLSPPTAPGSDGEGHFALMMEPPARVAAADLPPREYVFLVDVSGSMFGFPLETSKALLRDLAKGLRPTDTFDLVLFAGASKTLWPRSMPASQENLDEMLALLARQQGGGGTELMGGLQAAYAVPRTSTAFSRSVVLVTDGYVGVETQAFRFVREHLADANLFAFGIGSSVNRALMEGMARAGFGEPFVVSKPEQAAAVAERFRTYIESPVLTNIQVAFRGFDAYDVLPSAIPDLMASRPLVVFGKYRGQPVGSITVKGRNGAGPWQSTVAVKPELAHNDNAVLVKLWARKQAEWIEDELAFGPNDELAEKLGALGVRYGLLTRETSFVAIDHVVANTTGDLTTSNQALPLPEGVSNLAVGSEVQLSRSSMPPGDPLLTVTAPSDALKVTAYFPFGLVKDLTYDPTREQWQTRFLVPNTVADGDYTVPVVILLKDGTVERRTASYRIDSQAPDFETHASPTAGGVAVEVVSREPLREVVVVRADQPAVRIYLDRSADGRVFTGTLGLSAGSYKLRVVAADEARNEADELVTVTVQ